ncbi:MAG: TatD family hydrolase [Candidatus Binatia bacterium]
MRIFEPHIHMASRVTDDYEHMARAGIVAVCEPAFWQGQPRTHVGTFIDYFDLLLGFEPYRASQYGIRHFCTIALNPKEANDERVNEGVIDVLPRYLEKDGVVAVGEVGFDDRTATEERFFRIQIELATKHDLPLLVHLPHRDKVKGLERTLAILREMNVPPGRALVDHNTEETVPLLAGSGHYVGFSIYPDTKMTEERVGAIFERYGTERMIVNSAADWGRSDPLKVPKTVEHLRGRGFSEDDLSRLVWRNPVEFFSQSGRLAARELERPLVIDRGPYEGNSLLRGGQTW